MRRLCLLAAVLLCMAASVCAADVIWDIEAVDPIGFGTHPKVNADYTDPANAVVVEGVALAGVDELLNPNGPVGYGNQYTAFIQDDASDRGGIQAWAGSWFYGQSAWNSLRLSDYIDFQAGDRLRITGFLQDAGRGKVVINHRHSIDPDLVFHVEVIGHPGLPDPEFIPSVSQCAYFDPACRGGGELYQTRYVMLHGVTISGGTWGNGNQLTVSDGGGSVGMLLSVMGDFTGGQPSGKLNIVGIFDQEDITSPFTSDYRVWVKKQDDVALALNYCREARLHDGERVALANKLVSRVYDGYFYIQDPNRGGAVRVDSDRNFSPGDVVCVQGVVSTIDGETVITPKYIAPSRISPGPLFVTSPSLWGENGLDVDGLLVRCAATIGADQGGGIYSMLDDAGRAIYLQTNGIAVPAQGTMVTITAVAAKTGGVPLLRLALPTDIQTVN